VNSLASRSPFDSQKLGPKPGDVYREYSVHSGGGFDWRMTDPNAKSPGAQEFLPNPILNLNVLDLRGAIRAEAVLDRWGGNAGTKQKMIRFNSNGWITIPELATTPTGHDPQRPLRLVQPDLGRLTDKRGDRRGPGRGAVRF